MTNYIFMILRGHFSAAMQNIEMDYFVTRTMVIHVIKDGNFKVKFLLSILGSLLITYVN